MRPDAINEELTAPIRRRCGIYNRISQDRAHDELGVARQEKTGHQIAKRKGWEVVDVFTDDDRSGFTGKPRKRYLAMVDAIKAGEINAIVTWAPDRLTRHPRELEDFIDLLDAHNIEVATHIAGDYDLSSSGGRMTARVVGSVARHESEVKSEKAKLKSAQIAETGGFHGGQRPFGYAADGVTLIPEEAEAIRYMGTRVAGGTGLRRVQAELNERGVPTVGGGPWRFTAVSQILTNPRIAGLRHHKGEIVGKAAWPAILDRKTWDDLQAILRDPRRKQARPARYLLTGLVVNDAGQKMTGARAKGNQGDYTRRVYHGPGVSVDAKHLEAFVVEYVLQKTDNAALPRTKQSRRVPSEVAALEEELEQLAALRGQGKISLREWMAAKGPLDERLDEARRRVPEALVPAGVTAVLGRKGRLRAAWEGLSYDEQRRALGAVLEKVVVQPIGPSGNKFDTDRIQPVVRKS
jgi:DNA invertase Pin-like site-specific DNA recombinase